MKKLHKWEVKKDTGKYHYLGCVKCGDRAIKKVSEEGFQPIELHILKELIKQWRFDYDIERSINS